MDDYSAPAVEEPARAYFPALNQKGLVGDLEVFAVDAVLMPTDGGTAVDPGRW